MGAHEEPGKVGGSRAWLAAYGHGKSANLNRTFKIFMAPANATELDVRQAIPSMDGRLALLELRRVPVATIHQVTEPVWKVKS